MKLLVVSAFLIACAPLSGAQAPHTSFTHGTQTAHIKPKQNLLPQTTLEFKPVGDALPVSADAVFVGNTVCANGRFYFNAIMLPGGEKKNHCGVSDR